MNTRADILRGYGEGDDVVVQTDETGRLTGVVRDVDGEEFNDGGAWAEIEVETGDQRITVFGERADDVSEWTGLTADFGSHEEVVEGLKKVA